VGTPQIGDVLTEANVTLRYVIEQVCRKDSLDLTDEDRGEIRHRVMAAAETHILITHGTDTMTQTAACLADIPGKVIVFTGSMAPARFRASDAVFNIGCAVAAAQIASPGVYIAMNGQVFPAAAVRKNRDKGVFELITAPSVP
jgi:L-asparaginase